MNSLWIFGDNSSSIFGQTKERRFVRYLKFREGIFPKTWSELLSKKLKLRLQNYAIEGQSNYDIFDWFLKLLPNIKKDDIVIIGWTDKQRFRLVNPTNNEFVSVRPESTEYIGNPNGILNQISTTSLNEYCDNRKLEGWNIEIYNWENTITYLSKLIGFKIIYWTFDSTINKSYYLSTNNFRTYLMENGAEDITLETNGYLIDDNFGEKGHQIQFEYFLNYIENDGMLY